MAVDTQSEVQTQNFTKLHVVARHSISKMTQQGLMRVHIDHGDGVEVCYNLLPVCRVLHVTFSGV